MGVIEKMTWKRSLCFNFQLPLHVEMTCVHLNFFIDSEEHWSSKINREGTRLKSEVWIPLWWSWVSFFSNNMTTYYWIWTGAAAGNYHVTHEALGKLCIYFAVGYVVVLIFSIIYLISPKCVFAEKL
jgi:hypothetical protein